MAKQKKNRSISPIDAQRALLCVLVAGLIICSSILIYQGNGNDADGTPQTGTPLMDDVEGALPVEAGQDSDGGQ